MDKVFVIAEAGSNWKMGSPARDLEMGKLLIDLAVEARADGVKFQVFRADTTYAKGSGFCRHLSDKGVDGSIRSIFRELEVSDELLSQFAAYAQQRQIAFLASAFSSHDFGRVDPLVAYHKIASPELHHPELLDLVGQSGKPVFLSTGLSSEEEIEWALHRLEIAGAKNVTLLQCTVQYPTAPEAVQLRSLTYLAHRFGRPVGLSDHTRDPLCAPIAALALGARVIEKHFTLDNRLIGPDHNWAITGDELKQMVSAIRQVEQMMGREEKSVLPQEAELRAFSRRSLQTLRPIQRGERLHYGLNLGILRPGDQPAGLHPRHLEELEGREATRPMAAGEGIQQKDFK